VELTQPRASTPTATPEPSRAPEAQIEPPEEPEEPVEPSGSASPMASDEPDRVAVPRPERPGPGTGTPVETSEPAPVAEFAPAPEAATMPNAPAGPAAIVGQVVGAAVEQVVRAVRPEAAVAVATEFTFPLALALAVLGYLVIQGQIDRRDPKLRVAPQNVVETLITFKTEEEL
jgi:hypothetical protein